ncbi:MAG: long-chain fatty acid--CoA ligase [Gordonia sp. (in: high G+C Gram-positive bacteria)]
MMHAPLSIARVLEHGRRWNATREVITDLGDGTRRRTSFADVAARATRLSFGLAGLGVAGDQRVGTFMWNNQEHLEAYLGVPAMGAVLHTANIRLFPDQVAFTINAAQDEVMIVDGSLAESFADLMPMLTTVRVVVLNGHADPALFADYDVTVVSYDDVLAGHPVEREWPEFDEQSAASICYTTGTTGNPKGVAYSHRSILMQSMSSATMNALRIGSDDVALIVVPMFHATAWGYPYSAFWFGADMVLLDRFLSPKTIASAVKEERVTFGNGVPTVWADVLRVVRSDPDADLSSLQRVVIGGAAVTTSLLEAYDQVGAPILQGWGMTETSPLVSAARTLPGATPEQASLQRLSQGRVLAGVDIRLVEPESGEVLPNDGVAVGEFELRGPWISGAYLDGAGVDSFRDGWLRTGDVGTLDADGYVRLVDRAKDVIKSGGEWISSVELEDVLLRHDDVEEVSVIGVPDGRWDERPLALVVPRSGAVIDADLLRDFLVGRVARWWIPERWVIVEQLPRTSVGKYDKKRMRASYQAAEFEVLTGQKSLRRD